jgi:hypothetical protein
MRVVYRLEWLAKTDRASFADTGQARFAAGLGDRPIQAGLAPVEGS